MNTLVIKKTGMFTSLRGMTDSSWTLKNKINAHLDGEGEVKFSINDDASFAERLEDDNESFEDYHFAVNEQINLQLDEVFFEIERAIDSIEKESTKKRILKSQLSLMTFIRDNIAFKDLNANDTSLAIEAILGAGSGHAGLDLSQM